MGTHLRPKTWAELKAMISSAAPLDYKSKSNYVQVFIAVGNTIFYANLYPPTFKNVVKGRITTDADYTDFYDNYKPGIDTNPPSTEQAVSITQTKSTNAGAIVVTHNFCDPCTWYGDSVGIEDEVLADSGDGLAGLAVACVLTGLDSGVELLFAHLSSHRYVVGYLRVGALVEEGLDARPGVLVDVVSQAEGPVS